MKTMAKLLIVAVLAMGLLTTKTKAQTGYDCPSCEQTCQLDPVTGLCPCWMAETMLANVYPNYGFFTDDCETSEYLTPGGIGLIQICLVYYITPDGYIGYAGYCENTW